LEQGVSSIIQAFIASAWRRRRLILAPLVIFSLAGLAAAFLTPRTYASKTLLLLQEEGAADPLRSQERAVWDLRSRVSALEALVKSNRILTAAALNIYGKAVADDPVRLARVVDDLRDRLAVTLVGGQFVSMEFKDSDPTGARDNLNIVVSRLLEALLLPSGESLDAASFLIDLRRKQVRDLETALEQTPGASGETLADLEKALSAATQDHAAAKTELAAQTAVPETARPESPQTDELAARVGQFEERIEALKQAITQKQAQEQRQAELETQLAQAKDVLAVYQQRFRTRTPQTVHLLGSPEQIKVVDAADIPKRPASSRMKMLLLGVAAGIALGIGLAMAAEALSQTIRTARDAAGATGLPVLARLPGLSEADFKTFRLPAAEPIAPALADAPPFRLRQKSSGA
jgi:uncharacterized protein involved in exopolysaccharide biosynthesis